MSKQFTLKEDEYGLGLVQLRFNVNKLVLSFMVLLFEKGRGVPEFSQIYNDYHEAEKMFYALFDAIKLGRGISLKKEGGV